MSIRNRPSLEDDIAPPPLPPPRYVPVDPPFEFSQPSFANRHNRDLSGDSQASSYGSVPHSPEPERPGFRRHASGKTIKPEDEGYHSLASTL
jgi:hypothetical protein